MCQFAWSIGISSPTSKAAPAPQNPVLRRCRPLAAVCRLRLSPGRLRAVFGLEREGTRVLLLGEGTLA